MQPSTLWALIIFAITIQPFTPTLAILPGGGYTWSVSSQGTIVGSANNQTVTIAWTTSGTAKVFLELDSAGTTLYDTLIVTVKRYPLPYITAIKIYGCQVLDTIPHFLHEQK